jgi:predicted RNA-binding Zn-ribbon protein involved in translation (DUF1610 family)
VNIPKRLYKGETEWYCPNCNNWVAGRLIEVTGYTNLICEDCGITFDDDYYGLAELEIEDGEE